VALEAFQVWLIKSAHEIGEAEALAPLFDEQAAATRELTSSSSLRAIGFWASPEPDTFFGGPSRSVHLETARERNRAK
jgi:hypothetical protein